MSNANFPVDPYRPPTAYTDTPSVHRNYGGIGRAAYLLGAIASGVVQQILNFAVLSAAQGAGGGESAAGVAVLIIGVLGLVVGCVLAGLRMKNQGSSPWWGIGIVVPLLNLWVGLRCLICPEGYADHKTLDTGGKIAGGILIGLIVLSVLLIVILAVGGAAAN